MTEIPVILCFDERILLGAGVTILSMLDSAAETTVYDVRILHPGLSSTAQNALRDLVAGTRHKMDFCEIPSSRFDDAPSGNGSWTEIVYYRLLASEFLPDCDRAIYSDVDVLFKRDMEEAFAVDIGDAEWAGVAAEANTPDSILHHHFPENENELIFFSGFMVMNLKAMRENGAVARYFETISTIGDRLKFFDLDVLNIATPNIVRLPFDYVVLEDIFEAEDFRGSKDHRYLSTVYSDSELEAARNNPAIIHYAGPRGKPWQRQQVPQYYADVVKRLPKGLHKQTFRDWRKKWLSARGRRKHYLRSEA